MPSLSNQRDIEENTLQPLQIEEPSFAHLNEHASQKKQKRNKCILITSITSVICVIFVTLLCITFFFVLKKGKAIFILYD